MAADLDRGVADGLADRRFEVGGRGDLDDLLVPALNRAIAFEEVDEVACPVAEKLDFDMLGLTNELLDEDVGDAEGVGRLSASLVDRGLECIGRANDPHPPAAAAHRRLDDDGIAQGLGQRVGLWTGNDRAVASRKNRHAHLACELARGHLVAQPIEELGRRPNERDPTASAGARELGVL